MLTKGDAFKKVNGMMWPVYCIINGQKNRLILEMAKPENSENTTHVDFGRSLAIIEHSV